MPRRQWLWIAALCGGGGLLGLLAGCLPRPTPPPPPSDGNEPVIPFHQTVFTEIVPEGYQGPRSCQICHLDIAQNLIGTGHWKWEGTSVNIVGHETETHGARDLLNSFFIGIPSNEGRCAQCHPSYGYVDKQFDFTSTASIDCLVCHDSTGTYQKDPTAGGGGGQAALLVNGALVPASPEQLKQVVYNVALPTRRNCGACHFAAEGADNVMHGDMSADLLNPSRDLDVHMGGLNFACQQCHSEKNHGIAGFLLHSVTDGGDPPACTRCHGDTNVHSANPPLDELLNPHLSHVACESCHIPLIARNAPTRVAWFWDTAGQDVSPIPTDEFGLPTFDKQLGTFVWAKNVKPEYRWHDGTWQRKIIGVADTYSNAGTEADPVVMAEPAATKDSPGAKVTPFKKMVGRQPADTVNQRLLVPHLFGAPGGANPFWEKFDWGLALADGAAYTGVPFSGTFGFVNTVTFLQVNHEVAPREAALRCNACHGVPEFWAILGVTDPLAPPH
jgi:octaheme c-type cytochrome (tetrathionate reductase family)